MESITKEWSRVQPTCREALGNLESIETMDRKPGYKTGPYLKPGDTGSI